MKYNKQQVGYSLVEVLIAIAVLLLSIAGPLTIATKSLQTSFDTRDQVVATFLAQEALEGVIAVRQNAMIAAIKNVNFNQTWDWVNDPVFSECFAAEGCNIDVTDNAFPNTVTSCATPSACIVTMDGTDYTRRITLEEIGTGTGADTVEAVVTVTWANSGFGGTNREVTISTVLYDTYGDL